MIALIMGWLVVRQRRQDLARQTFDVEITSYG
jgi:hypothetical protein